MVTGNAPDVTAVWLLTGPGGADTALIFGSTKLTVGPAEVNTKKYNFYLKEQLGKKMNQVKTLQETAGTINENKKKKQR